MIKKNLVATESSEKPIAILGGRVEKLCTTCGEERGHVIRSLNKRGKILRVSCAKCGTVGTFKSGVATSSRGAVTVGAPYDRTISYRAGQVMLHPIFGPGEVTALIEPHKIDVLFSDRLRRLVHANHA
ncbi:MAG TPA: hypothetical protein VJ124_26205 [Pyrinomonadaceae bacterium]|nr:hypothetical protein [Pyrinomonadaceae bacterium]